MDPMTIAALISGGSKILGGLFGNSSAPYEDASRQYRESGNQAQNAQNPFMQFGQQGMGGYTNWLSQMQNPGGYLNGLMGQYQESPWAHYQQNQGIRQAQNAGSASGLSGSTAMNKFLQQNAQGISSQDMQGWLNNALGINEMYGHGLHNQIGFGANAANHLSDIYGTMGNNLAGLAYGSTKSNQDDLGHIFGGAANIFSSFLR